MTTELRSQPNLTARQLEDLAVLSSGALLLLYGATRRSRGGVWAAIASAPLLYRGFTGQWPITPPSTDTRSALAGNRGLHVREAVRLNVPIDEVYRFWRRLENLPQFMTYLTEVREGPTPGRSHWVVHSAQSPLNPSLDRFRHAQDDPTAGFESSLEEIRTGRKRGHWIWYIFPQLAGLGSSSMSQAYGIADAAEAELYLRDPVLGPRLLTITGAVADQVRSGASLSKVLGSAIDVQKLVSAMTLFGSVARGRSGTDELARLADELLQVARAEGYPPCQFTLDRLRADGP